MTGESPDAAINQGAYQNELEKKAEALEGHTCENCGAPVEPDKAPSESGDYYCSRSCHEEDRDRVGSNDHRVIPDGGRDESPSAGTNRSPLTASEMDPENNEYATPPKIWRPLARALDGFDVDPCSGAEATPIAETRFTKEDNGLEQPWHGDVFANIPWASNGDGSAKEDWLTKARNEVKRDAVGTVVVVLPSDTGAHWFHDHVFAANAICFVGPGRIPFLGADRNPSFALVIVAFGPVDDELADALGSLGEVVRGRSIHDPTPQTALPVGDSHV